jgi:SulP family sulfate permease
MRAAISRAYEVGADFSVGFWAHARRLAVPHVPFPIPTLDDARRDAIAGLTVATVIIPNAMAYTLLVGLPPQMGLYATLAATFFATLWGSSPFVITGSVGIVSLLTLTALVPFAEVGSSAFITLAITLAVLVGIIQACAGLFRLGYLARLIPHAVLIGFSSAASLIIAMTQVPSFLGFSVTPHEHIIDTLFSIVRNLSHTHPLTAAVGIATFAFLTLMRRVAPSFPAAFTALFVGVIGSWALSSHDLGIATIGDIPARMPIFDLPELTFSACMTLLGSAAIIALVGFMETYAIAKTISGPTHGPIDADRELFGQGLANMAAGVSGGFPVSGSFSASAVNVHAGARTPLASIVVSVTIIIAVLFLTPLMAFLPKVVLAAIVITAVLRMANIRQIAHAYALSWYDGVTAAITFGLSFLFKPDDAVIVGITVALIILVHRIMFVRVAELGFDTEWHDTLRRVGTKPSIITWPRLIAIRIDRSILYTNSERIVADIRRLIDDKRAHEGQPSMLVINCAGVNDIDLSGIEDLGTLFADMRAAGTDISVIYAKKHEIDICKCGYFELGDITFLHDIDELKQRYAMLMARVS